MSPQAPDRQSMTVRLVLVVLGVFLAAVAWFRFFN